MYRLRVPKVRTARTHPLLRLSHSSLSLFYLRNHHLPSSYCYCLFSFLILSVLLTSDLSICSRCEDVGNVVRGLRIHLYHVLYVQILSSSPVKVSVLTDVTSELTGRWRIILVCDGWRLWCRKESALPLHFGGK